MFGHGLSEEAIFGALRKSIAESPDSGDLTPGISWRIVSSPTSFNARIAREIYRSAPVRRLARDQRSGYPYLIDGRSQGLLDYKIVVARIGQDRRL